MKIFFYDLETTGTRFWKNGIHQISALIYIDGKIVERLNYKVKPYKDAIIEKDALDIAGVSIQDIESYNEMNEVYNDLILNLSKYVNKFDKTDKFHLCGFNINAFDNHFFRAFFVQNNDSYFGSWFWSDSIDLMPILSMKLAEERTKMKDFKLATVAEFIGIDVDRSKIHDALYDVELCFSIFEKIK